MKNLLPIVLIFPTMLFAQTIWDGTVDSTWYTANKSVTNYTIKTAKQLAGLAAVVNSGITFQGKTITLDSNIALNDTNAQGGWRSWNGNTANLQQWTPIGDPNNIFKGTFKGNNKVVTGLYINSSVDYQGLFGVVNEGSISNLGLAGFYVKGGKHSGSISGRLNLPELSCNGLPSVAYIGSVINAPTVTCSIDSLTDSSLTNEPYWSNPEEGMYNVIATGTCDGITGLTASCGTLTVTACTAKNNTDTQYCSNGVMKNYGTLTDNRDGNIYKTVVIGTQTWMANNLGYNASNSRCYSKLVSNCGTRYYNWATAMNIDAIYNSSSYTASIKHRGICPEGWHIPSDAEWSVLTDYVGELAGWKLKSVIGFSCDQYGCSDDYGFSATPAGYILSDGNSYAQGTGVWWWSSTEDASYVWMRRIYYSFSDVIREQEVKSYFLSVRCLKD